MQHVEHRGVSSTQLLLNFDFFIFFILRQFHFYWRQIVWSIFNIDNKNTNLFCECCVNLSINFSFWISRELLTSTISSLEPLFLSAFPFISKMLFSLLTLVAVVSFFKSGSGFPSNRSNFWALSLAAADVRVLWTLFSVDFFSVVCISTGCELKHANCRLLFLEVKPTGALFCFAIRDPIFDSGFTNSANEALLLVLSCLGSLSAPTETKITL